jgi:hypothetical protein
MEPSGDRFPDDLEVVASRLRAGRAEADPVLLDQIKQPVIGFALFGLEDRGRAVKQPG